MTNNKLDQSDYENRVPDCVLVELKGESYNDSEVDMYINANFNEHELETFWANYRVGLRGGNLCLKISNGEMPVDKRKFCPILSMESIQTVKGTDTISRKEESRVSAKISGVGGKMGVGLSPELGATLAQQEGAAVGKERETTFTEYTIHSKGDALNPCWDFEATFPAVTLKGAIIEQKLGAICKFRYPLEVEGKFCVRARHLLIISDSSIPNTPEKECKRKVINLILWKWYLKPQMHPYLSRIKLVLNG